MECEPGAELQVDFGTGARAVADGRRRRLHLFRAMLSHSRKGYSEVVWRQHCQPAERQAEAVPTSPMIEKHRLCPERVRRMPPHFSWFDHCLAHDHHLRRADAKAWALYLVLVTVGDEHGLSYYPDGALGRLLSLRAAEVAATRGQLAAAALIAHEAPLYQVLALDGGARRSTTSNFARSATCARKRS